MKYAVTYGVIISKCKDILVSTNRINIHWATEVTVYKLERLMNFLYTFLVKRDSVHFPCAQASHSVHSLEQLMPSTSLSFIKRSI